MTGVSSASTASPASHPPADASRPARLSTAPTRYRAIATVQAPAEQVRARTPGLGTRLRPLDDRTCRLDASDDHLPRIARTLTGLDADYTLDADPDVLTHLRDTAQRTLHALNG